MKLIMTGNREVIDITYQALFHDIGKLIRRSKENPGRVKHEVYGLNYLQENIQSFEKLTNTSAGVLLAEELDEAVKIADRISAGERELEGPKANSWLGELTTILNPLARLSSSKIDENINVSLPPCSLDQVDAFKSSSQTVSISDNYKALLKKFTETVKYAADKLSNSVPQEGAIDVILLIMEQCLSRLPSYTYSVEKSRPDISLYTHSLHTAALAGAIACLKNEDNKRFLSVTGDLQGIQKFIYNISPKYALKILRMRSFYLELLLNVIARDICTLCGLLPTNILRIGGGKFELLLPDTDTVRCVINEAKIHLSKWFYENFKTTLSFNISEIELDLVKLDPSQTPAEDIRNYLSNRFSHYNTHEQIIKVGRTKNHWQLLLESDVDVFKPREFSNHCSICYFDCDPVEEKIDEEVCDQCFRFVKQSAKIKDSKYCIISINQTADGLRIPRLERSGNEITCVDNYAYFEKEGSQKGTFKFVFNSFTISDYTRGDDKPLFAPSAMAFNAWDLEDDKDKEARGTLTAIAKRAKGGFKKIGVLRADVDNLGKLLSPVVNKTEYTHLKTSDFTLTRRMSITRYLNQCFQYYIPKYINVNYNNTAIIYSGGDDLLLVGSWDEVLKVAEDINDIFHDTHGRSDVTISAGMVVSNPKFPFIHLAEASGNALDCSKKEGKNSITIFYSHGNKTTLTFSWKDFKSMGIETSKLLPYFDKTENDEKSTRSTLRKLLYYIIQVVETYENRSETDLPLFELISHLRRVKKYDLFKHIIAKYPNFNNNNELLFYKRNLAIFQWLDYLVRDVEK